MKIDRFIAKVTAEYVSISILKGSWHSDDLIWGESRLKEIEHEIKKQVGSKRAALIIEDIKSFT